MRFLALLAILLLIPYSFSVPSPYSPTSPESSLLPAEGAPASPQGAELPAKSPPSSGDAAASLFGISEDGRAELNALSLHISNAYGGAPLREIVSARGYLVIGSSLPISERELFLAFLESDPDYSGIRRLHDDVPPEEAIMHGNFLVILGGPSQNSLAASLEGQGLAERTWEVSDKFVVRSGTTPSGGKFIIFSGLRGYNNLPKNGIKNSPLALLLPEALVPPLAFLLSVLALAAMPVIRIYLAGVFKAKEREKVEVQEKFTGIHLFGIPIRFRELVAVFLGAFFYALGITYLFTGPSWELIPMGIAAVAFVAVLYYLRSIVRWVFDSIYKTHSEYTFWKAGGALCWISAIFGFTLQTPGFEAEKIPKEMEGKAALMRWGVLSAAMLVALLLFVANLLNPNPYLQVFQTVASAIAVTEILPFAPMPGVAIKRWNFWLWAVTFSTFIPAYFLINFYI